MCLERVPQPAGAQDIALVNMLSKRKVSPARAKSATPPPRGALSRLSLLVEKVHAAAKLLTVHTFQAIRSLPVPAENERKVCGAFLSLFSEIDDHIEAAPSFQVLASRFWDSMLGYCQQPGHVAHMVRRFPDLLASGRISTSNCYSGALARAARILTCVNAASLKRQEMLLLYSYTQACLDLHRVDKSPVRRTPVLRTPAAKTDFTLTDSSQTLSSLSFSQESTPVKLPDPVRELQWRLDDALRLFLREKLWAQTDVVGFVQTSGQDLLREFSASVRQVTRDLPEPLQTQGVGPFLDSLSTEAVFRDVIRVFTLLTPASVNIA